MSSKVPTNEWGQAFATGFEMNKAVLRSEKIERCPQNGTSREVPGHWNTATGE
jgi:hypothetical protein